MKGKKGFKKFKRTRNAGGFTLVEAILAVAFLGLIGTAVSALYASGSRSLDETIDAMLLDSRLRSRMEFLVSTDFASLGSDSDVITLFGKNYTITWTVNPIDLDGDATPETSAKAVTVSVTERPDRSSLTTIIVDYGGKLSKIS